MLNVCTTSPFKDIFLKNLALIHLVHYLVTTDHCNPKVKKVKRFHLAKDQVCARRYRNGWIVGKVVFITFSSTRKNKSLFLLILCMLSSFSGSSTEGLTFAWVNPTAEAWKINIHPFSAYITYIAFKFKDKSELSSPVLCWKCWC